MTNQGGSTALAHGGNLLAASARFGIPLEQWQDLSTGISPWSWPVAAIPNWVWARLPNNKALLSAASSYYGVNENLIVASAGSQMAIRTLPSLVDKSSVAIPAIGYQEHRQSWALAGHKVVSYTNFESLCQMLQAGEVEHAVLINPNNPTAETVPQASILALRAGLNKRSLLLIDEAFADVDSSQSLAKYCHLEGLIVLKSVGKFFGLAGIRLGFAMGTHPVLQQLNTVINPWAVSNPAAYIGSMALGDSRWQQQQRKRIEKHSAQLYSYLSGVFSGLKVVNGSLFVSVFGSANILEDAYEKAAKQGILLRYDNYDEDKAWLRVGLADDNFKRLQQVFTGEKNAQ